MRKERRTGKGEAQEVKNGSRPEGARENESCVLVTGARTDKAKFEYAVSCTDAGNEEEMQNNDNADAITYE